MSTGENAYAEIYAVKQLTANARVGEYPNNEGIKIPENARKLFYDSAANSCKITEIL
ncbi:hypothetical protein GCM10009120_04930 [Sphingobacterium siyangense subsp. cladoniae]|uniref:hypothetical protein n=1 Tax=Sphingobacterium siyangense TaxID=459529 RepID=UPI0031F730F7